MLGDAQTTHLQERENCTVRSVHPGDTSSEESQPEDCTISGSPASFAAGSVDWLTVTADEFETRYPLNSRPHANLLNRRLARALSAALPMRPSEQDLYDKPVVLTLHLPLPPALRFYAFTATQHEAERQTDTYKIQLTHVPRFPEGARWKFSREAGVRPILIGLVPSLAVFILWDANVNDTGSGFTYSKSVQAPPGLVYEALANGMAVRTRRVRGVGIEEIVAVRQSRLVDGLLKRIELSNRALIGLPSAH